MIKNLTILALVTLNAAFGYALYEQSRRTDAAIADARREQANGAVKSTPSAAPTQATISPGKAAHDATVKFKGSYLDLASALRNQGFDEDLIREIVFATMNRDHIQNGDDVSTPYWKKQNGSRLDKVNADLAWQQDERQQLLNVFGPSIVNDPLFADLFKPLNKDLPFLSSDKQIALYELQQRNDPRNMRAGFTTREGIADFRRSRQQEQASIQQLLTPDEYLEYQLRESPTARMMRQTSDDFDYTEQEFRDIYKMRADEFSTVNTGDRPSREDYQQMNADLQSKIENYLGPDRYAEYTRSQDFAYRALKSIGDRYGNSDAQVIAVYNATKSAQDQISALRSDTSLSPQDKQAQAQKIQQDTLSHIANIAGQQTADSVKQNMGRLGLGARGFRGRRGPG
ncbi:MAG TPA: hypothetical protein VJ998_09275 [Pseudomonadales bacterium]|nr:hypothetical protein [Pseudomonadales bacterium]